MSNLEKAAPGPYFDEAGLPVLRESYIAFVDDLGTKEAAKSMDNTSLRKLTEAMRAAAKLSGPGMFGEDGKRLLTFSDNVAISMISHADTEQDRGRLFSILDGVATYQLFTATEGGRAVRGGLTKGALHVGDHGIYGPSLVRAVDMEKPEAIHPRVIVDHMVLDVALGDLRDSRIHGGASLAEYLLLDGDGWPFVNYLNAIPEDDEDWLNTHKQFIERWLAVSAGSVRDKYIWVAIYHNFVIRSRYASLRHLMVDLAGERSPVANRVIGPVRE